MCISHNKKNEKKRYFLYLITSGKKNIKNSHRTAKKKQLKAHSNLTNYCTSKIKLMKGNES